MHDEELEQLQAALAAKLRSALADAGLTTVDDVVTLLRQKKTQISLSTITRYWNGRLPTEDKAASKSALETIAGLTEQQSEIMHAWQELVQYASARRSTRRTSGSSGISGATTARPVEWLQVIPEHGSRSYTSIDLIEFTHTEGLLDGTFVRLFPAEEAGFLWNIRGYSQGDDAFHYAFRAHGDTGAVSVGAMSLMVSDFRPRNYKGRYSRRDLPASGEWVLVNRKVEWYKRLPSRYLNRVALIDFDNTLRSGWTLLSLATSAAFHDLVGIEQFRAEVDIARSSHESSESSHDTFATETAQAYANLAKVNTPRDLEQAASTYVHLELKRNLFPFSKPLVAKLRDHDIAPILVTGVPSDLARQIGAELAIEEVYGVEVTDGAILRNTGTAEGKREVVSRIARESREIVLAAGDSESDLPLMSFASIVLAKAGLVSKDSSLDGTETYQFAANTEWLDLEAWLDERLPVANFPRLQ
jgi:phosphoserine phosphatase